MRIINKIIISLFKKIIKKNKFIKDELINYLNNEYFDELKKVVKTKENEIKKQEFHDEEKIINFNNVKSGDVVVAKLLNPGDKEEENAHLYRPFFIVGRSKKKLHGLYCTTKKKNGNEYFPLCFCGSDKTTYLNCSRIISVSIDEFIHPSKYKVKSNDARNIIKKMLHYKHNYNEIDFKAFFNKITFNSIVLYDNNLYKISGIEKNGYKAYPLSLSKGYNNISEHVIILGKKYVINESKEVILKPDKITLISDELDLHTYEEESKIKQKRDANKVGDKKVKSYRYGDVLSIKNSKNKIIYITESNKKVYYVTYSDIDFFKGISRINKSDVIACYDHLSDEEKEKLTNNINRAFESKKGDFTYLDLDKIIPTITMKKN